MVDNNEYKDSGIEWIGEIPRHWSLIKLNILSKNICNGTTQTQVDQSSYPVSRIETISGGVLNIEKVGYIDNDGSKYDSYLLDDGDILFSHINSFEIVGQSVIYRKNHGVLYHGMNLLRIVVDRNLSTPEYLHNYLKSNFAIHFIRTISKHAINQVSVSISNLSDLRIPIPPLEEQKLISRYLDKKTSQIDSLITKIEKKIELLKEQRTSLINHYVTKGLDPNAKMKDSGIEWIGEIPRHWKMRKIKYLGSIKNGEGITFSELKEDVEYPVYGGNGIVGFYAKFNLDQKAIIIGRVGEKCGNIHLVNSRSWISDNSLILNLSSGENFEWISLCLETRDLNKLRNQSSQPLITGAQVKNENIPYPPSNEMKDISEYIQNKSSNIDSDIQKSFKKIELLKEYRQSLISSAVTGKLRITKEMI